MDGFSKVLWFAHKKYYKRSRREIWEYICLIVGFYIFGYYLLSHCMFGIWLYASAERPKYIIGPVFANIVQALRFAGIFHVVVAIISLIALFCLLLGMKFKNIQYVTTTTVLINLIVLLDILLVLLLILYWDKLGALKIIFAVITQCCWFVVNTYKKILKREIIERQQKLKRNPFHSYKF